jgi:hypothetical protein
VAVVTVIGVPAVCVPPVGENTGSSTTMVYVADATGLVT